MIVSILVYYCFYHDSILVYLNFYSKVYQYTLEILLIKRFAKEKYTSILVYFSSSILSFSILVYQYTFTPVYF